VTGCSVPHHTFRFTGRCQRDWSGDGPKVGWLMWQSVDHEVSAEGIVRHWFAIAPEKFWTTPRHLS
jgi:hypothetical protein